MDKMEIVEILQAGLVPIVILSSAGLISLSLQQRYGRVIDRIRYFHGKIDDEKWKNVVEEQLDILILRGRLLRNAMFSIMLCILFALITTLTLSLQIIYRINSIATILLFFLSLSFLLIAVLFAIAEIFISYKAVLKEDEKIRSKY